MAPAHNFQKIRDLKDENNMYYGQLVGCVNCRTKVESLYLTSPDARAVWGTIDDTIRIIRDGKEVEILTDGSPALYENPNYIDQKYPCILS